MPLFVLHFCSQHQFDHRVSQSSLPTSHCPHPNLLIHIRMISPSFLTCLMTVSHQVSHYWFPYIHPLPPLLPVIFLICESSQLVFSFKPLANLHFFRIEANILSRFTKYFMISYHLQVLSFPEIDIIILNIEII